MYSWAIIRTDPSYWSAGNVGKHHSVRHPPQKNSLPSLQAEAGCSSPARRRGVAASSPQHSGGAGGSRFSGVSSQISGSHYFSIRGSEFRIEDPFQLIIQFPWQFCHPYDSIPCLIFCPFYSPTEESFFKSYLALKSVLLTKDRIFQASKRTAMN